MRGGACYSAVTQLPGVVFGSHISLNVCKYVICSHLAKRERSKRAALDSRGTCHRAVPTAAATGGECGDADTAEARGAGRARALAGKRLHGEKDARGECSALTGPQAHRAPGGGRALRPLCPPSRRPLPHPSSIPPAGTAGGLEGLVWNVSCHPAWERGQVYCGRASVLVSTCSGRSSLCHCLAGASGRKLNSVSISSSGNCR